MLVANQPTTPSIATPVASRTATCGSTKLAFMSLESKTPVSKDSMGSFFNSNAVRIVCGFAIYPVVKHCVPEGQFVQMCEMVFHTRGGSVRCQANARNKEVL